MGERREAKTLTGRGIMGFHRLISEIMIQYVSCILKQNVQLPSFTLVQDLPP